MFFHLLTTARKSHLRNPIHQLLRHLRRMEITFKKLIIQRYTLPTHPDKCGNIGLDREGAQAADMLNWIVTFLEDMHDRHGSGTPNNWNGYYLEYYETHMIKNNGYHYTNKQQQLAPPRFWPCKDRPMWYHPSVWRKDIGQYVTIKTWLKTPDVEESREYVPRLIWPEHWNDPDKVPNILLTPNHIYQHDVQEIYHFNSIKEDAEEYGRQKDRWNAACKKFKKEVARRRAEGIEAAMYGLTIPEPPADPKEFQPQEPVQVVDVRKLLEEIHMPKLLTFVLDEQDEEYWRNVRRQVVPDYGKMPDEM